MMENLLTGVVSGFIASIIFFTVLATMRPRLAISECISRTQADQNDPPFRYRIKIVNRSRRTCVDVEISAFVVRQRKVPNGSASGTVDVARRINLRRDHRSVIPGYSRGDDRALYAQRVRFDEEAVRVLEHPDQQYELLVRVTARDGVSGWPRVFERRYALANAIVNGTFEYGRSLQVVPWQSPAD